MRPGLELRDHRGETVTVTSRETRSDPGSLSYNLDVIAPDTFFVAGDGEETFVLAHNAPGTIGMYGEVLDNHGTSKVMRHGRINGAIERLPGGRAARPFAEALNRTTRNPMHHIFFDAWLNAKYDLDNRHTTYRRGKRKVKFPAIELPHQVHQLAHYEVEAFIDQEFDFKPNQATMADWQRLDVDDMKRIAEKYIDIANGIASQMNPAFTINKAEALGHAVRAVRGLPLRCP